MLEALGYRVIVFTTASEVLNAFKKDSDYFDVLVTAQTMPGMTGEVLAQQVMQFRPHFPVISSSGFSYTMSEGTAHAKGCQAYLTKPVLMDDMARAIQLAIEKKRSSSLV